MPEEALSHPSTAPLPPHKLALLNACASASVLKFGTFILKSGRESPYFFNAGLLHSATLLETLGDAYAVTILEHSQSVSTAKDATQRQQIEDFTNFDVIFGPAYKGLPLAIQTLSSLHRRSTPTANYSTRSYAFNRKELKPHGDGGIIVGSPLRGKRVLIVDDVITAGTALREAVQIIESEGGKVVGVVVALDRQERTGGVEEESMGPGSAVGELRRGVGVPVLAVLGLDDLIGFAAGGGEGVEGRLREYRERYGARD